MVWKSIEKIFVCLRVSYNAKITSSEFFKQKPQTIYSCEHHETIGHTGGGHLPKKEWVYEPVLLDFELVNCNGAGDSCFFGFYCTY